MDMAPPGLTAPIYEYRKDAAVYVLIMCALYAYREIIRLRMGEAQLSALGKRRPGNDKEASEDEDRILVSKAGLSHFIEPSAIDWVEAAGNDVGLHVGTDIYMLRGTIKDIES